MRSTLNHQPWLKVICLRINICLLLGLPGMHRSNPCPITSSKVGVNACGGMMTTNRYPYHCPINRRPNDIPHGAHTASYSSLGYYGWILKHIGILRPMTMETRCCNFSYQNYSKNNRLRIRLYRHCGQKVFFFFEAARVGTLLSRGKSSTRRSKTAHVTTDLRSRHRINPRPTSLVCVGHGQRI